jgi:mannose-6-phosphate isomerase-like protein (cupin superfamily)
MRRKQIHFGRQFAIVGGNRRSQAAEMTLPPGVAEGGPDNRHGGCDQWLLVVSGVGRAIVSGRRHKLGRGALVLIEKGQPHEIRNTGRRPLRTLNFYVPPAYRSDGAALPRGR